MAAEDKPTLTLIAGPNGSGKSTLVAAMQADGFNFGPLVNPDITAAALPARTPSRALQAGRIATRDINKHIAARQSFAQETTLTGSSGLRVIERAKTAGYRVNVVYIGIQSLGLSSRRVAARVALGGHDVPAPDQERRFGRSHQNVGRAARLADNLVLLDNSRSERAYHLTADIEQGTVRYLDREAPAWSRQAVSMLPEASNPERQLTAFAQRIASSARNARQTQDPQPDQAQADVLRRIKSRVQARQRLMVERGPGRSRDRGEPER